MIGQHARGLPVPQCGHTLLPGGSACVLYSLVPGSLRCVEAEPRHIPRGQSQPTARKKIDSCFPTKPMTVNYKQLYFFNEQKYKRNQYPLS